MSFSSIHKVYNRAVVAVGFTPRLNAILNESHRILKAFGTLPIIVHVGEDNSINRNKLEDAIDRSNFRNHPPIYLIRPGQASDVLSEVAVEYEADLIIAGALKKEGLFKYYFGSVARTLARSAPCSVMLFTEPKVKPIDLGKIQCAVEYDDEGKHAVDIAANVAYYMGSRELYLTHTFRVAEWEAMKSKNVQMELIRNTYSSEDEKLVEYLTQFDFSGIATTSRCLYENTRTATLDFAREIGADLLIMAAPGSRFSLWDRIFPQNLELALQNLPCSILMTRKMKKA